MDLSNFVERLSELMFDAGLNAKMLSNKLGCAEATVYHYLQGIRIPSAETVGLIADFFKCSTDFLLGLENENYSQIYEKAPPFNERFPELLKQCNISQYRLEKIANISHSLAGYWKNGGKKPTIESIIRIAKALDRSVDFVLGRTKI